MECTKGELRVSGDYIITSPQNREDFLRVCKIISLTHAKELVRRWNAFEKDGLMDELLTACKAQEEADNWFGASDTGRKLKDKAKKLRIAAIAKVT